MTATPTGTRPYDIVLFGATGFVGKLTAAYLARSAPEGVTIALGGRSRSKLEQTRDELGLDWPLVVADSGDEAAVAVLARSARVVVTTVGPYARYGLPLVQACARAGTHYADLTGESLFVRKSIDTAHDDAVASGARIVHSCGFDSVPSDLGVLLAAEAAQEELADAVLTLVSARGGFSGGTLDSLRGQVDEVKKDKEARRLTLDPYALSPDRAAEPDLGAQSDLFLARREAGQWVAPFVMASYNTRIVRRSNALLGWGPRLAYREVMSVGGSPVAPLLAAGVAVGTGALAAGLALPGVRQLLDRVLPSPGEGPDEKTRENGRFHTETIATTASGRRFRTTIKAKGDPGYAATAVMLGEAGLALALDDLPAASGVLTPASGIGSGLADRLRAAGFTIEVAAA